MGLFISFVKSSSSKVARNGNWVLVNGFWFKGSFALRPEEP